RPPHAPASAYFGRAFLAELLFSVPNDARAYVASACTAAILAHHGGWWPQDFELHPPNLWSGWDSAVKAAIGKAPREEDWSNLRQYKMDKILTPTTGADSLADWWPLVAYLTRTLRLSDQRATAEGTCHE
ncbi:MAG TPA: hypothetical protein VFS39_16900, partial [Nitrospira sp.]|nr:hypothetical protein [Nitrospira sp.]